MSEEKHSKAVFICRIVTVLSAIVLFILITVMMTSKGDNSWLDGAGRYIFLGAVYVLSAGTFLPPFIMIGLKIKTQSKATEDKIKALEQEIDRLKKK